MVRVADGEEIGHRSGAERLSKNAVTVDIAAEQLLEIPDKPLLTSEKAITKLAKASPHRSDAGDMRCSRTQNGKPCSGVVGNIAAGLRGNMNAWKESISRMREPDAALDL